MEKSKHVRNARSCCPIACALDEIGDKWTLLIVRDLLLGRCYYKEFAASPEKISTNILADRLQKLVKHGIAERYSMGDDGRREAYRLTSKGKRLGPVIKSIVSWGLSQIDGTEALMKSRS